MSFKTKRWALLRTVNMGDFVPGIKSHKTPGGAGINTRGFIFPFRQKIVVMAYAADDTPIWCIYNPATHTLDTGATAAPAIGAWANYSAIHGWNTIMIRWREDYLLGIPTSVGYYYGRGEYYGFDQAMTLKDPDLYVGTNDHLYMTDAGPGVVGGVPCVLSYQWDSEDSLTKSICKHMLTGSGTVLSRTYPSAFFIKTTSGSPHYYFKLLEGYWCWWGDDGRALYASPPEDADDPYLKLGSFGVNYSGSDESQRGFVEHPSGGAVWCKCEPDGEDPYWAVASAPLSPGEKPWSTTWQYRNMRDGGYEICEGDLDGIDHDLGITIPGPGGDPITFNSDLGWYVGLGDLANPTVFDVYVLDPQQPVGRPRISGPTTAGVAFVGDYSVGDNLRMAHVLPFPDERDPSGVSRPPLEKSDGHLVGAKELFLRRGNSITYLRDMKLKFEGYSFGEDWWWPGENPDHTLDTTLDFFAGATTIMGRYPDPTWGRLNPLGSDVSRGLGVPEEHLDAQGDDPIYIVRESQVIAGTRSWVTPGSGYQFLRGSLRDPRMTYNEYSRPLGSQPQWNARGGMNAGGTWHTIVNFEEIDPPDLGQSDWTILGLCTIPACRSLPRGGWLVSAELYFAPWESWEWDPGPRDLTFRDTGFYGVPAKPGYIGPLPVEEWHPKLLTAYDEWTAGRSDYGAAALIVFDHEGHFVECLNDFTMYPPESHEIAVLPGSVPRLMYRVKGGGTYSDSAEGWGGYQSASDQFDFQGPLFAVYELENQGRLMPGCGRFLGFVDAYVLENHEPKELPWRWSALAAAIDYQYPKLIWLPYDRTKVESAIGGGGVTLLTPRGISTKSGVHGVSSRSER